MKKQAAFSVSDDMLGKKIKEDVKNAIVPIYKKFEEKYAQIQWATNKTKYQKYSSMEIEKQIDGLFLNF